MKIICFGSINKDLVYSVDHIPVGGETILCEGRNTFWGGKGLNQAVALAKASDEVYLAGFINESDKDVLEYMRENNIKTDHIRYSQKPTGHAVIYVASNAQNCITVYSGSNHDYTKEFIEETLENFDQGDIVLIQNETNGLDWLIDAAYEKGMQIAINPSPFEKNLLKLPLEKISFFLYNEIEAMQIAEMDHIENVEEMLDTLVAHYTTATHVLTLGSQGVVCKHKGDVYHHGCYQVDAVDTTAAGDTFTGYFLASIADKETIETALSLASKAAAIAVSRQGATVSIPTKKEVLEFKGSLR